MHFANVFESHAASIAVTGTVVRAPLASNTATLATPFAEATRFAAATVNHIGTVTMAGAAAFPSILYAPVFILPNSNTKSVPQQKATQHWYKGRALPGFPRSRFVLWIMVSVAVAAAAWAVYRLRCDGRPPLNNGNCPDPSEEADPSSLKQGSIPGNRDGTPGQQIR
ncbi:MAG: hypothetical protein SF187_25995 [Deltaproteobacteria bacterium]|nr:hypothetical protein [Deltaproteobacteria bacterium]